MRWTKTLRLALICLLWGCAEQKPLISPDGAPVPVVLIALDTLRADQLGCYGATTRTPHIDRLAREGILFEDFAASAPWTLPSFGSAFTGLYPAHHGAVGGASPRLASNIPTLAEWLGAQGYESLAFVSVDFLGREFGLARGFPQLLDASGYPMPRRSHSYQKRLSRFLERAPRQPWLMLVHFFDAHAPYLPPPPFGGMYYDGDPRSPQHAGLGFLEDGTNRVGQAPAGLYAWLRQEGITDPAWPVAQYRAGVSHVDSLVGEVIGRLESSGLLDEVIVVLFADHGEHLGEHSIWYTHRFPYEETLHVPLILRLPGAAMAGQRVSEPASVVDLLPTLADLLNLPMEFALDGRSLVPALRGKALEKRVLLAEYGGRPDELVRSIWNERWRLVHWETEDRSELFDRHQDRAEERDVAAQHPEVVESLLDQLYAVVPHKQPVAARTLQAAEPISPEVQERLRALGYID